MPSRKSSVTRRDLFKASAGAATVVAIGAPTIIPSSALGNQQKAPPSERLNLGFIGVGKMNSSHLGTMIGHKEAQVMAICDVDKTRREHFKNVVEKKYGELERKGYKGCGSYEDYRELLARPDIDGVFIATPDHWHTTIAIEACKAKKDIYCEKPLTLTIQEAKLLIDAVRKYDRVFQTGSQQRSEGPFRQACEYVLNGRLGKIREVHVGIGKTSQPCDLPEGPPHEGLNWDKWLGQAPKRGYNEVLCRKGLPDGYPFNPGWRDYREFSGGHVTDWGAHHYDITQWALQMDNSGPVEILPPEGQADGWGAKLIYRGSPVGDEIVVSHDKVVWTSDVVDKEGRRRRPDENGIRFVGERGELFVSRSHIESRPGSILQEPLSVSEQKLYKSPGHREDWMACVRQRRRPLCDVEVGARSVTVCHLVNLAYWHGRKLKWDPRAWEFPGDAEANGWRGREQREPYKLPSIT
ncbi:MAG TPA: Gfo/Idh/MocA family oxidoreductase [Tepidisphaeraceae bacterium]|nr:Gfo/Idh/MocA family oxidoreductase [Tepidisphaeraceae bacterium]